MSFGGLAFETRIDRAPLCSRTSAASLGRGKRRPERGQKPTPGQPGTASRLGFHIKGLCYGYKTRLKTSRMAASIAGRLLGPTRLQGSRINRHYGSVYPLPQYRGESRFMTGAREEGRGRTGGGMGGW